MNDCIMDGRGLLSSSRKSSFAFASDWFLPFAACQRLCVAAVMALRAIRAVSGPVMIRKKEVTASTLPTMTSIRARTKRRSMAAPGAGEGAEAEEAHPIPKQPTAVLLPWHSDVRCTFWNGPFIIAQSVANGLTAGHYRSLRTVPR